MAPRQGQPARPDAFLPDLAQSLNNLGERLKELDRREEALTAYHDGVAALSRPFLALPYAFARQMQWQLDAYRGMADQLTHPLDQALVAPIQRRLAELNKGS